MNQFSHIQPQLVFQRGANLFYGFCGAYMTEGGSYEKIANRIWNVLRVGAVPCAASAWARA